jgi:hypothetical protein
MSINFSTHFLIKIDSTNVNKFLNPFLGNKGYINIFRRDGKIFYRRDEKLDLIEYESIEPFKSLLQQWKSKQGTQELSF